MSGFLALLEGTEVLYSSMEELAQKYFNIHCIT